MKVNTDVLRSRSAEMQTDISRIKVLYLEVWMIRQQMREYESLEETCLMLKSWSKKAEEELDSYRRFQRLTAAVADKYDRCEKTVIRQVEHFTIRRYPPRVIIACEMKVVPGLFQLLGPGGSREVVKSKNLKQIMNSLTEETKE